jgi:hypothetical protein
VSLVPIPKPSLPLLFALAAAGAVPALVACGNGKDAASPTPSASASTANATPPPGGYPPGQYPPPNATTPNGYPPPNNGYPPPNNGYPPPNNGYPPPNGTGTAPPPATASAPAPTTSSPIPGLPGVPLDPNLLQQIAAAGAAVFGQGAAPVAVGDPVEVGVKAVAAKSVSAGMQPEGNLVKDTLAADAHRSELVSLQGGRCYTIVAYSPPGQVTNVDLHLLLPPFYSMEAGHDAETDNTAVIGKGAAAICPALTIPVQYKLDIHAKAGAGAIGVQIYSKPK